MVNHYCDNSPAGGGKCLANLRGTLVNKQESEKGSSSKAEQPYAYLNFARRSHAVRDQFGHARENAPVSAGKANPPARF
jgi:hypothetical protein